MIAAAVLALLFAWIGIGAIFRAIGLAARLVVLLARFRNLRAGGEYAHHASVS